MTLPEPQPASSTTSSPLSVEPLELLGAQACWGRRDPVVGGGVPVAAGSRCITAPSSPGRAARARARSARSPPVLGQRQRDVVEAVQQPVLDLRVDLEARRPARPADLLGGQVDLGLARLGDRGALLGGQLDRQQPDLGAVGAEDVGEARGDDRLEAVVLERPGGVLAARAAAEVAPGDQDRVGRQLPARLAGPSRRTGTPRSRCARSA